MSLIRRRSPVAADGGRARPDPDLRGRRSRSTARRLVRGVLVVAAGTAALSLAGPFALRPFTDLAGAAGEVTVAFVLDFGSTSADLVVGCVTVPASDSRYDALTAFVASRGLASPTYATSGLLCSINGTPTSGCGQTVPGGYVYWSYFTAGQGAWTYSSTGAFATVSPNDVEGWRFQNPGSGRPNDPAPRATAQYQAICPATPPSTTTTTTTTTTPSAPDGGGTRPGGGASTTPGGGGSATPAAVAHAHAAQSSKGGTTGSAGSTSTTTTTSTRPSDSPSSLPDSSIPSDPKVAVATVARHVTPGPGPVPLIVGGLVVAGLAAAAWLRWRRRPRTP